MTLEFSQSIHAFNYFLLRLMANSIDHKEKCLIFRNSFLFPQTQDPCVIRYKSKVILWNLGTQKKSMPQHGHILCTDYSHSHLSHVSFCRQGGCTAFNITWDIKEQIYLLWLSPNNSEAKTREGSSFWMFWTLRYFLFGIQLWPTQTT